MPTKQVESETGAVGLSSLRVFDCVYAHDRRQHRHRCRCCNRIIEAGEAVVMLRHPRKHGTWALHSGCADSRHSEAYTWREVFRVWGAA